MPGGRPTKYKSEYCDMVVEWLAEGKLLYNFAKHINVGVVTLHDWRNAHEEFSKAIKKGEVLKQYIAEKYVENMVENNHINNVAFVMYCRNFLKLRTKDPEVEPPREKLELADKDRDILNRFLNASKQKKD